MSVTLGHRVRRVLASYNASLTKRPIATKTLTAATIAAAGDLACQYLTHDRPSEELHVDWKRTGRMVLFNLGVTPLVHYWYLGLTARFPHSPVRRVVADQLLWAPAGLAAFLITNSALETGSFAAVPAALDRNFVPVLQANYAVWPLIQLLNFSYVPGAYQVLVVNVAR